MAIYGKRVYKSRRIVFRAHLSYGHKDWSDYYFNRGNEYQGWLYLLWAAFYEELSND